MKKYIKTIIFIFFCTILVFNTCFATVYANELTPEEQEILDEIWAKLGITEKPTPPGAGKDAQTLNNIFNWIAAQHGAIGDYEKITENNEALTKDLMELWTKDNVKVQFSKDSLKPNIVFSKNLSDQLLKTMKEATKGTNNGGYELIKTVPVSKISRLYFNTNEEYSTLFNLLKDNNGIVGYYLYGGYAPRYYKVDASCLWVKGDFEYTDTSGKHKFYSAIPYKNVNSTIFYEGYTLVSSDAPAKNWEDTDNLKLVGGTASYRAYNFQLNDAFSYMVSQENTVNPLRNSKFLITNTGASIPVFNTLNDAIAYSVANNLYYTTSDFTGEGMEITISDDELEKILSGYYSGMYDMLQKLIEQNGGNALTPEQVQALADQVAASFDMLKAEINKGFEEQDALIQANSNILKAIKSIVDKGFGSVNEKLDELIKQIKKIKNWTAVNTVLEGLNLLADLADFIKDFFDDVTVGVGILASGLNDTASLVTQKFPFSIPWDIAFLIAFLADTPQAPVFELPFELKSYGISETVVIDFAHFTAVSKVSRMFLTMIYIVGLLNLTNKIIANRKGA